MGQDDLIAAGACRLDAAVREGPETVDGIPVRWVTPDAPRGVALWLTHLGGSTKQTAQMLTRRVHRHLETGTAP